MKQTKVKLNHRHILALALAFVITATTLIPNAGVLSAHATISTPQEINDLGYLGRGVNLLREIDINDKSDDLLAQNHLKSVIDDSDLSDFEVSKDMISSSYGQGFMSKSFASLALSMGVDLSTKASASSNFVIGSAKMEAGFSMGVNISASTSVDVEYTIYNYQKYLDSWTLNWDNGGVMGSAATLRNHMRYNVYGALTDSFPQYTWSPKDFFDTYGTHIIVSYKRGGEYTFSSMYMDLKASASTEISSTVEASGETSVSSFGSAGFETKVANKETMSVNTEDKIRVTSTFSRGSSQGQLNETDVSSVNSWGNGVDDKNAQVLSSGLTLVAMWDLLPAQYADRKAELKNYYNEQVAENSNDLLNKFVYKTVNEGDFDFSQYDAVISTAGQLDAIRNNLGGKYILACDIDLAEISNWEPIGSKNNKFTGILDGNNNTIYNMSITDCKTNEIGLFGFNTGIIKNLSVHGIISLNETKFDGGSKPSIGGIVGYNSGTIENCQNNVRIDSQIEFDVDESDNGESETAPTVNTTALFNSAALISIVPDSISALTVLDLRNISSTNINKTITITPGAQGIKIIGDKDKTYSGLHIEIQNSEYERYIVLENMNWEYTSADGAIHSTSGKPIWIVSEGAENKIFANMSGIGTAINVQEQLIVCGTANLTIDGANGGNGSDGFTGSSGANGSSSNGSTGSTGTSGTNGSIGGTAVSAKICTINVSGILIMNGGIGGQGGVGGQGGQGGKGAHGRVAAPVHYDGWDGGKGGQGGMGGAGGLGGSALKSDEIVVFNGTVILNGGKGGQGGKGGSGGAGGAGGDKQWPGSNGKKGVGGQGGKGGAGGMFGAALVSHNAETTVITVLGQASLIKSDNGLGSVGGGGVGGSGRSVGDMGANGDTPSISSKQSRVDYYVKAFKYSLYDAEVTQNEAANIVNGLGGTVKLATIYSEPEQQIINDLFTYHNVSQNKFFWIGATRVENNIDKWKWEDGVILEYDYINKDYKIGDQQAYTNWAKGQPTSNDNENYLAINSNGFWSAKLSNTIGGFITQETLKMNIDDSDFDLYVGGVVGFNQKHVNFVRNDADIKIKVATNNDFNAVISGVVGSNTGNVSQALNKGKIDVDLMIDINKMSSVGFIIRKITFNEQDGSLGDHYNMGDRGILKQLGQNGSVTAKWEWDDPESEKNDKTAGFNDEWGNGNWTDNRVHVVSIDRTDFLLGEVLINGNIVLSYVNKENKRVTSSIFSYKYDFSKIGVTAIRIQNANFKENVFIPVSVVKNRIVNIEIDLDETITNYQYGDDYVLPIIKKTMSDGMTESILAKEEAIRQLPVMTNYGVQAIKIYYSDEEDSNAIYELEYDIVVAQKIIEETAAQLKIQNRTAVAGDEVHVQFSFANMPELKSVMLYSFIYDKDRLEIINGLWHVKGEIANWDAKQEIATFTYKENTDSNEAVFELILKVKEDCPIGDYTISCSAIVNASNGHGNDSAISLEVSPGNVNVIDVARGDFDGNGVVDEEDAIQLLRYTLFGSSAFSLNQSGDVNGDDIVNSDDAIYLLRYTLLPEDYPLYW